MDMIHRLHGTFLIYTNNLSKVGMCFYAPMLGIIHIFKRPLRVKWIVNDIDTSNLVVSSGIMADLSTRLYIGNFGIDIGQSYQKKISSKSCTLDPGVVPASFQEIDSFHEGILLTPKSKLGHLQLLSNRGLVDEATIDNVGIATRPTHHVMSCESSSDDGNIGWDTHDYSGFPLAHLGEFHLDCIMRCAHQFSFSPQIQDLIMSLRTQKDGLNKRSLNTLWYDMFPILGDESKCGKSLTSFSLVGCLQMQEFEIWFDWTLGFIRVAQRKSVGVEFRGLPVRSWDLSGIGLWTVWMPGVHHRSSWVAELFFKETTRLHGLSRSLVDDKDIRFLSAFRQELFRWIGAELTSFMDLAFGKCRTPQAKYWIQDHQDILQALQDSW